MKLHYLIVILFTLYSMNGLSAVKPTLRPQAAKPGVVIKVIAPKVPEYCDFQKQIVNIGYDKESHQIMACVKRTG